jgi:hypothetical protein
LSSGNVQYLSSNPAIVGEVCDLDIQWFLETSYHTQPDVTLQAFQD